MKLYKLGVKRYNLYNYNLYPSKLAFLSFFNGFFNPRRMGSHDGRKWLVTMLIVSPLSRLNLGINAS